MRVLVTGREGQLVQSLRERAAGLDGIELIAVGRPELDLERPGGAAAAIADRSPDLVINAAAYTRVDDAEDDEAGAFRVNAAGAGEVAEAAEKAGAAVVQVSTDYVFDGRLPRAYREDDPTAPLGAYGRSKLAGEEAVRSANGRHAIVRTAWVYGPFGRNFVRTMWGLARTRERLDVVADQLGTPTSSLHLADGLLALAARLHDGDEGGLGRTYHLAGTGEASWHALAAEVAAHAARREGKAASVHPIRTVDFPTRATRPANSRLDSSLFAQTFGYRAPPWREGVAETVDRLAATA